MVYSSYVKSAGFLITIMQRLLCIIMVEQGYPYIKSMKGDTMLREYILYDTMVFSKQEVKEMVAACKITSHIFTRRKTKQYRAIRYMVCTNGYFDYDYVEIMVHNNGEAELLLYRDNPKSGKYNEKNSNTQRQRPRFARLDSSNI